MSLAKQEFTDAGRSMLGRAQAGETLHVTKLVVGSGYAAQASDLWPLTQPVTEEHLFNISTQRDYGQGTLLVEGSFKSDQVGTAFLMRELGVYAHIGNEADRLYSISNVFTDQPDNVDPASPSIHSFKVKLVIDRIPADQLVIQIGPTEAVMGENVGADSVGAGVYKEAAGNVLRFKRLVGEIPIHITEAPDTITIGTKTLQNNLDLYVPMTHPEAPSQDVCFPTIQEAHNYLLQFMIPTNRYARIHVWGGYYVGRFYLYHPNGSQISMVGQPRVDMAVSQINPLSATRKNVSFVGGGNGGLIVNQLVYLMGCNAGWAGGAIVTNVYPSYVTLMQLDKGGRAAYAVADHGTGRRLSTNPTVLYTPDAAPWTGDEVMCACSYGYVADMCFVGGYHALHTTNPRIALANISAWSAGVGITGAYIIFPGNGTDIIATNCGTGVSAQNMMGHNILTNFCANANDLGLGVGDSLTLGAVPGVGVNDRGPTYFSRNGCGVRNWGGILSTGLVLFDGNGTGFECKLCGSIVFGPFLNYPSNNGKDLYAYGCSYIQYHKATGAEPTCDPVKNTAGVNGNAYIYVA